MNEQRIQTSGRKIFLLRFARKLVQYTFVIIVALTINFSLPRLAPGDPLIFVIGSETANEISPEKRKVLEKQLGLDGTMIEQYGRFIGGTVQLDLGSSTKFAKPVTKVLGERMPWTFIVVLPALVLSPLIGIILGAYAAWNRGKKRDVGLLAAILTLESMPAFWVGMVLIAVFGVALGWLPTFGAAPMFKTDNWSYAMDVIRHLILPVVTITLASAGTNFLLTRSSMLDTLGQDYMMMAEAKGVRKSGIIYKHALRNALLPVYTHVTMSLGILVSGAVVVEMVFSYPGIGSLLFESVIARDYALMQGVFLIITIGVILANLLADLTYPLVDPRARIRKPVEGSV
jgi:peptide/nickel transport system permease protein